MGRSLKLLIRSRRNVIGLVVVILIAGAVGLILALHQNGPNHRGTQRVDLLHGHDWADFAGAEQTPRGVIITPLGRKIVHQDGSGGQPNPPVNLAGPKLSFSGDFTLEATMQGYKNGDTLQLYGGVPVIYDEWRYEPPSIQFALRKQLLDVSTWNGTASAPSKTWHFALADTALISLRLVRNDDKLTIIANGKKLGTISAGATFSARNMWFGAASAPGNGGWMLTALTAQASPKSLQVSDGLSWDRPGTAQPTLQKLAANRTHPIYVGAAMALNPLLTDARYRGVALSQFSMWTTENDLKPQFIHPQPDTYSFKEADLLVNTALKNHIAVHGHTLVFGEANPRWMRLAAPAKRQQIMTDHITTVMTHFKGRIREWDVIDEPLSDNDSDYANGGDGLRRHIWYQAMGSNYIDIALRTAHGADPASKLYINDYGLEADGERWTALIRLVAQLKAQGVPLYGIGFESHVYDNGDHIDPAVLERHIQQLARMGLASRISEIDVHGENAQQQAQEYDGVLKACLHEPSCTAFSTWGISDKYGSTTDTGVYPLSYGNDLLWNTNLQPKPAYMQIMRTLETR